VKLTIQDNSDVAWLDEGDGSAPQQVTLNLTAVICDCGAEFRSLTDHWRHWDTCAVAQAAKDKDKDES
jgi:hypothetical protein